ncbi:hypothetical protein Plhal304r1_c088g0170601 [Plasmopara halstedii]
MATNDSQKLEELQEQISKGTQETKTYLDLLKTKLAEFDAQYSVSETASSYLQAAIEKTHQSVDELKELGESLKEKSKSTSAPVVDVAKASFCKVQEALDGLKERGRSYDDKFRASISNSVDSVKDGVSSATTSASTSIEHIVVATRERTSSSFEQLKETLFNAGYGAYVIAGSVVGKAEELDGRYGVVNTVSEVVGAVTEKVSDLDRVLGVSAAALKVDEKVTGGIGADLVNKGAVFVNSSLEYVTGALQQAKMAANEESKEKEHKTIVETTESSTPVDSIGLLLETQKVDFASKLRQLALRMSQPPSMRGMIYSGRKWKQPVVRDLLRRFSKRMRRAIKRRMKGESRRQWIERNLHDSEVGIMLDLVQCLLSMIMVISMIGLNWNYPATDFANKYLAIDTINLLATITNLGLRQVFIL